MPTYTAEELQSNPRRLLDDAARGAADVVTVDGEPVMLTLPLGNAAGSGAERVDLAITLFDRDQISLGLAAKVAGLSYSAMIDELSRRQIAVVRYEVQDLERELAYVRSLAGGR